MRPTSNHCVIVSVRRPEFNLGFWLRKSSLCRKTPHISSQQQAKGDFPMKLIFGVCNSKQSWKTHTFSNVKSYGTSWWDPWVSMSHLTRSDVDLGGFLGRADDLRQCHVSRSVFVAWQHNLFCRRTSHCHWCVLVSRGGCPVCRVIRDPEFLHCGKMIPVVYVNCQWL